MVSTLKYSGHKARLRKRFLEDFFDYGVEYRKYKIAKLFNIPVNKEFEIIHLWVMENIVNLKPFIDPKFPDHILYAKRPRSVVLRQREKNTNKFFVDARLIWNEMGKKPYEFDYPQVEFFLHDVFKTHFKFIPNKELDIMPSSMLLEKEFIEYDSSKLEYF